VKRVKNINKFHHKSKRTINSRNYLYYSVQKLLSTRLIPKILKSRINKQ